MQAPEPKPLRPENRTYRASVVIPAHDEAKVIVRCLKALAAQVGDVGEIQVVVAANGCSDDTVAQARGFTGLENLEVLDLERPSKIGALNAGDDACTALPRIYLDADIVLGPGALSALVEALESDAALIASPRITFDEQGASLGVRLFYDAFTELPYVKDGLVGLGVYGMSRAGRERFDVFPEVTADDLFAQRVFAPHERRIVDATFSVAVPRDLRSLIKVRTRVARGNAELARRPHPEVGDFAASTGGTVGALAALVRRRPAMAPAAAWYVGLTTLARYRARRTPAGNWDRDTSTR